MTSMSDKIRVLIADDHDIVHVGFESFFQNSQFDVVGRAMNGQEAIEKIEPLEPDLVLMDISMPVLDGISATKIIRDKYPSTKIIMFTAIKDLDVVLGALTSGAHGYCSKDVSLKEMISGMELVFQNDLWIDCGLASCIWEILERVPAKNGKNGNKSGKNGNGRLPYRIKPDALSANDDMPENKSSRPKLTPQEINVLAYICDGYSNQKIANELGIALDTAKEHVRRIFKALGAFNRAQAAAIAIKDGLLLT